MRIKRTAEFQRWYDDLPIKSQAQVEARLARIELHEHFGDAKDLGEGLAELRWANGWRVYFTKLRDPEGHLVLLLLGGMKNAQKKDIKKARLLVQKYEDRED